MSNENNRVLLGLERKLRTINRELINPEIPELGLEDLNPVIQMVARARVSYLKALFELATAVGTSEPSDQQIMDLKRRRLRYEELVSGAKAMETAIQRGYLDVQPDKNTPQP